MRSRALCSYVVFGNCHVTRGRIYSCLSKFLSAFPLLYSCVCAFDILVTITVVSKVVPYGCEIACGHMSWELWIFPACGKIKRGVRAGSRGRDVTCSTPFGSRNETNWGPPRVPFPRCVTSLLYSLTKHVEEGAWKAGKCSRCGRSSCQTTQGSRPPR